MRKLVWWGAGLGIAVWSILAFVAYGLIDLFGATAAGVGGVPGFPADPYSFGWIAEALRRLGTATVLLVWFVGAAGIAFGTYIGHRLTAERPLLRPRPRGFGSSVPSGPPPAPKNGR